MLILEVLLLIDKTLSCLVKLVNMIAQVLRSSKLEQVGIESRHMWLNVIKQEGLDQVGTIDSNGDLLKELCNGQVHGLDALLH